MEEKSKRGRGLTGSTDGLRDEAHAQLERARVSEDENKR